MRTSLLLLRWLGLVQRDDADVPRGTCVFFVSYMIPWPDSFHTMFNAFEVRQAAFVGAPEACLPSQATCAMRRASAPRLN